MGLDMYLYKKTYVKNWKHETERRYDVSVKKNGAPLPGIVPERITYIVEEVAYWRKANAIHKWFVDNVQEGRDECQYSYVSQEQLQTLLDVVNQVLASSELVEGKVTEGYSIGAEGELTPYLEDGKVVVDPSVAQEFLPSTSGFFFGSPDYDQYYIEDLRYTKETLERLLSEEGDYPEYEYHSSW